MQPKDGEEGEEGEERWRGRGTKGAVWRESGSRNKRGFSDLVKSEMTCVECVCWAQANFSRLRGETLVSPFSFRDIEVDVQEKPKPLNRGAEREGEGAREEINTPK